MIPSTGRLVHYVLTDGDVESINRSRAESGGARFGNPVQAGDVVPFTIVKAWGDQETSAVNGQAMLDGNDSIWLTSRLQAPTASPARGFWHQPAFVPQGPPST